MPLRERDKAETISGTDNVHTKEFLKTPTRQLLIGLGLICWTVTLNPAWCTESGEAVLVNEDCGKCHPSQVDRLAENGGKHKTVNCLGCHREHAPKGADTIPKCGDCHDGKDHYKVKECKSCHSDPHTPLIMRFGENVKEGCRSCHPEPAADMDTYPSRHANQSCAFCHPVHKEIPPCSRCHEPHTKEQTKEQCLGCHPPHSPLTITYPNDTPAAFCVPCHKQAEKEMAKNRTKHRRFTCAFCHRGSHPVLPDCVICHGQPHQPDVHREVPRCGGCHNTAHSLTK